MNYILLLFIIVDYNIFFFKNEDHAPQEILNNIHHLDIEIDKDNNEFDINNISDLMNNYYDDKSVSHISGTPEHETVAIPGM